MNAGFRFCFTLALLAAAPGFAAKPAGKPSKPMPSAQLRHLIDTTMAKMGDITNPKQTFNRTPLTTAQAEFTAAAQTAPPEKQPMYQSVLNVVANLLGVVEEHNKAVADFENSKSVHGPPDTKDLEISNPQHGWDAAAVARANKAKEKHVNGDAEKAALDKDQFFSKGAIAAWTKRFGQLHDMVEQSYTAEVVAEKQLAMLTPPSPTPASKPALKPEPNPAPKEPIASVQHSPVGAWKPDNNGPRILSLKEDNTAIGGGHNEFNGAWKWADQSKGALTVTWNDGLTMDLSVSADGRTLSGKSSHGLRLNYTRGN